jgi:hypothetical protein
MLVLPFGMTAPTRTLADPSDLWERLSLALLTGWLAVSPLAAFAGPMAKDPEGFRGMAWGSSLADSPDLMLVETANLIKGYDLKNGPDLLGEARVDVMRFLTINEKFARVTVRYHGKETHKQVLDYLQRELGPLDRSPGVVTRGAGLQYNWRGPETEVNLTYEGQGERGYIFIDSRVLAPRFNDFITDSAE